MCYWALSTDSRTHNGMTSKLLGFNADSRTEKEGLPTRSLVCGKKELNCT
jgi:hypothetical protein